MPDLEEDMFLYFLIIRIAALFGHKKARLLVRGQAQTIPAVQSQRPNLSSPIWFHAASVGEFEQARPLIERLRETDSDSPIIVTFFSPSGYEARKGYDLADGVYYLPFATRRNARKWLDAVQPKMAVFVKYEFWPAYLRELAKRHIPTYSICSIFRKDQYFFRWWGKRQLKLLSGMTHIFVQDEASLRLLADHGVTNCSVAGDTRFDRMNGERMRDEADPQLEPIRRFIAGAEHVIVAGSTWPEDERLLKQYMASCEERTRLILVPHEIDVNHLHWIFNLFEGRTMRFSVDTVYSPEPIIVPMPAVMVVDTMGLLSKIYRFGDVAYIGGGFGVGIHNTIEAASWGMPVIFGPNYDHFREAKGLIAAGGARSVKNYRELETAMNHALSDHQAIGAKAAEYVRSELGATEKIYNEIFKS